jgi:hypothetical protein
MLLFTYLIFALSIGIEAGAQAPILGFEDLATGSVFNAVVSGQTHDLALSMAVQASFIPGKNSGYSFTDYGARLGLYKDNWRISPVLDAGFDYCLRKIDQTAENGFTLGYGLGLMIRFHYESLKIYPKFSYEGISDLAAQGGFFTLKLRILYEL